MLPTLYCRRFIFIFAVLAVALVGCDSSDEDDDGNEIVQASSTVTVAYTGRLEDGTIFDQSDGATFPLSQVIPGFREGLIGMRVGETKTFSIPPEDAYGPNPPPNSGIPPNATLIFDVEVLAIR